LNLCPVRATKIFSFINSAKEGTESSVFIFSKLFKEKNAKKKTQMQRKKKKKPFLSDPLSTKRICLQSHAALALIN